MTGADRRIVWVLAILAVPLAAMLAQSAAPPKAPAAARRAYQRAQKAEDKKRIEEARQGYEAAIALFPDYEEAWCSLGLLQAEHAEFAAAMRSFRQAIRSDPRGICPYLPLAMLEHDAKDWNALVEVTDRMLRLDSIDYPLAYFLKAAGHYNLGEYEEAEQAARAAQALDNRSFPQTWELLGWLSVRERTDVAAMGHFEQYLESMPGGAGVPAVRRVLARLMEVHPEVPREAFTGPVFTADANLALLQFRITPKPGELIRPLGSGDAEIQEDGVPQKTGFYEAGRSYESSIPVEILLLLDRSDSITALRTLDPYVFHENILDEYENVSIGIYAFSDDFVRLTKPTRDARTLKRALDAVQLVRPGFTPLFRSIERTIRDAAEGRTGVIRLLVVFSDGFSYDRLGDQLASGAAARAARELGVAIYPVLLVNSYYDAYPGFLAEGGRSLLDYSKLAEQTGGQSFVRPMNDLVLPVILRALAKDVLAHTHVAGYYTNKSDKPKRHEAQVVLRRPDMGQLKGGSRVVVH